MLTASGPGGINEIQYATLLMMIARHTGYQPGVFSHVVANEQIYDGHMDAANEMLERFEARMDAEAYAASATMDWHPINPILVLNPNVQNFYEMTIDDFTMENYSPMKPQLKLELGI
jgi:thymidylate synthase